MAKKEGEHRIEEQVINLEITGDLEDKEIKEVQDNFVYYYKEYIVTELQKAFDEYVPHDVDLQIDALEINLGTLKYEKPQDLAKQIQRKIRDIVQRVVRGKLVTMRRGAPKSEATGRKQPFSKMSILEHFLTKGFYPSWAGNDNGTAVQLMEDLLKRSSKAIAQRIFRLRNNKRALERLHQQFTSEQLQRIFEALYGSSAKLASKQLRILQKRLGKASEKAIWSAAIDYVLEGSSALGMTEYKEREFSRRILEGVQQRRSGTTVNTKIRAGFEGEYSDLQILEYFLQYGAIPAWADVDSKSSLQELMDDLLERRVAGLQRVLERHAKTPNFWQRLIFQFSDEQILRLLEPLPSETMAFIEDTLVALTFVTTSRQNIQQRVSQTALRTLILTEVLDYFFVQKKSKFIKKTFLKTVVERLATSSKTEYPTLVKELYKSVRRRSGRASETEESTEKTSTRTFSSSIRQVLEQLDEKLQQKIQEERQELRAAKRDYRTLERQLEPLLEKKEKGTLSSAEEIQLRQLTKQAEQLETHLLDLEDNDRPLDIEQVIQQRQALQNQLRQTNAVEQEKLTRRLQNTEKEFKKLRLNLEKEVQKALRDQEKIRNKTGNIAQQRLQRITNRLNKYYRAVKAVLGQLRTDQTEVTLFLTNINRALRGNISNEEKQRLRQERSRLQQDLLAINTSIEVLEAQERLIEEALRNSNTLLKQDDSVILEETSSSGTGKLDALIFMLQYGATPWWAEDLPRQSIEELFLEFADKAPQLLLKAFQRVGRFPVVWQRVMNQLSEKTIRTVITQLYPTSSKTIFEQAQMLQTIHFAQAFDLKTVPSKVFQWGVIFEYLLTNTQGFNAQDFVKEVTLQTARVHNLSPSRLLELTTTIAKNQEDRLGDFLEWNKNLAADRSLAALEREMASYQQEQQAKEEGTFINDQQQLELLVEFLSTGKITERAKAFQLTTQRQFEDLLIHQIQKNRPQAQQVLFNIMRLSNARQFVIKKMDESFFWELVFLVRPEATLPAKRHFEDLRILEKDSNLALEKDVLFNIFISNPSGSFKIIDFVRALVLAKQQATGRRILAIITDWKRQLKARGTAVRSSLLLSVLLLEVDALKTEQREAKDLDLKANLTDQINFAAKEYTDLSVALVDVLSAEAAEIQSVDDQRYSYTQLEALIAKNRTEMAALVRQINAGKSDALDTISLQRKLLQFQATLEWLELRRPPVVRRIENSIRRLKRSISGLEEEIAKIEETGTTLEDTEQETDFELSLIERQVQLLEFLDAQNPVAVDLLEPLLLALKNEEQRHALFFADVQRLVGSLRDERLRSAIVAIVEKLRPNTTPLAELQRDPALDTQQAALLKDFNQQAPVALWQAWDDLEAYFEANPEAFTPERQKLQQQIYRAIRRREEQNLRNYVANLRLVQQNLSRQLDQATTLEELEEVQEQVTLLWEQQRNQAEELLSVARDENTRNDYQRLRRNIDHIFTRIQNTRIRRANALRSDLETDPKALLTGQTAEVELLEEELKQVVLTLEDAETLPNLKKNKLPSQSALKSRLNPSLFKNPCKFTMQGWFYSGRMWGGFLVCWATAKPING